MRARLQRLAGLTALWASLELLERIAYRAGVTDAAAAADQTLRQLSDDLQPADCSDVLAAHGITGEEYDERQQTGCVELGSA